MPFSQKPFKPKPEVEILRRRRLTFEDATALVQTSLKQDGKQSDVCVRDDTNMEVPGVALVSFQHIPTILQTMEQDWLSWPKDQRQRRSCFVEVTGRLETHLHPCFLSRLDHGLRVAAAFMLHRWVERLGCIPLCFVELKPAGTHAAVVAESPYAHFLLHFRAVGFAPQKGDWLVGRMNQTQISAGMNVTVLGLVNCFIRKANLPDGVEYIDGEGWRHKKSKEDDSKGSDGLNQVWLQVDHPPQLAKMRSNSAPDLKCVLGWPSEKMPATLRKARAAGKTPKLAKHKNEVAQGRGSGRGRGVGEASKLPAADTLSQAASPPSTRKSGRINSKLLAADTVSQAASPPSTRQSGRIKAKLLAAGTVSQAASPPSTSGRIKIDSAEPADVQKPSGSGGRGRGTGGQSSDAHPGEESRPAKKEKRSSTADEPSKKRRRES